jgi:hypothetical protein
VNIEAFSNMVPTRHPKDLSVGMKSPNPCSTRGTVSVMSLGVGL